MPSCPVAGPDPFAAAHLGELTQIVTPALVDMALDQTRRTQVRVRKLPSRVMVYFVLAMALFGQCGYRGVWAHLAAGLAGEDVDPSAAALRQARRRVGSAPLALLFDQLKGTTAAPGCAGAFWRGLRTVAWDGTSLSVADTEANAGFFGRRTGPHGPGGYPLVNLVAIVECGTRALVDAVFGPHTVDERRHAVVLVRALRPGMLLLADRGFDGLPLMSAVTATGADLLWRVQTHRVLPNIHELPDGSYLSMATDYSDRNRLRRWTRQRHTTPPQASGVALRVIEAAVTVRTADGVTKTCRLRLVTTLLDHERYPASELAALYHQRWEAETAYFGLKVTLRIADRVLRSGTVDGVRQELFGLLIVYQAARLIAADAAAATGIDPDRISLTVTLRAARLTVIAATGLAADGDSRPTTQIRAAILHPRELGPRRRRARIMPRRVKRTISPFAYGKTRHDQPLHHVTIDITITGPPTP